jgi:DNA-binding response OmpR family regulator
MNVLLVEDEERIASLLARGLRRANHRVEVLGEIVVTARSADEDQRLALELGVSEFLLKPFPMKRLLECLDEIAAADVADRTCANCGSRTKAGSSDG